MNYQLWNLTFLGDVHFGEGGLNTCSPAFGADTLFSAICIEAVRRSPDVLADLVQKAKENRFRLSDAMPYTVDDYYLPKPMLKIKLDETGNSIQKKALKKLEYIPLAQYTEYLQGKLDVKRAAEQFTDHFGIYHMVEKVAITGNAQPQPYGVETFRFHKDSGLYICVGYEDEETLELLEELMDALQYAGIGGERSAGYGKFHLLTGKLPTELKRRFEWNRYRIRTSLSLSLPKEEELTAALTDASFQLVRKGGFIESVDYTSNPQKKKDLYVLSAGATFTHTFEGDLYDVSEGGQHPVYRYAKPMFMGVVE